MVSNWGFALAIWNDFALFRLLNWRRLMMEDSLLIFFYFLQIIIKIVKQNFIFILVEILFELDFMISTIYIDF